MKESDIFQENVAWVNLHHCNQRYLYINFNTYGNNNAKKYGLSAMPHTVPI